MRHILDALIGALEEKQSVVIVAIVRSSGSAPRTSGARMLVRADGSIAGTVGGGALEGKCISKSLELYKMTDQYAELDFSLSASAVASEGMVCGGVVSVLLQKVDSSLLDTFLQLRRDFRSGLHPMLLTVLPGIGAPPQSLVYGAEAIKEFGPEFANRVGKKTGRTPFLAPSGQREVFVETLVSPGVVHLLGAGHVAFATAQLAAFADFEVVVVDDRAEFANAERYPMAREVRVVGSFDDCLGQLSPDDYVVIVTRGHLHDKEVLAQALKTKAGYIGMIGSRKKRDVVYEALSENGFNENDIKRVYSPIGLSIGADTPNEIALSIVAELVKVRAEVSY